MNQQQPQNRLSLEEIDELKQRTSDNRDDYDKFVVPHNNDQVIRPEHFQHLVSVLFTMLCQPMYVTYLKFTNGDTYKIDGMELKALALPTEGKTVHTGQLIYKLDKDAEIPEDAKLIDQEEELKAIEQLKAQQQAEQSNQQQDGTTESQQTGAEGHDRPSDTKRPTKIKAKGSGELTVEPGSD